MPSFMVNRIDRVDTESTVLDLTTEIELYGLDLNFLESLLVYGTAISLGLPTC